MLSADKYSVRRMNHSYQGLLINGTLGPDCGEPAKEESLSNEWIR